MAGEEAEGILGYVLSKHWLEGRCWLGGDVARGLGWCHIKDLHAYRLDAAAYETWVANGRTTLPGVLPKPESAIPIVEPTRAWCFRACDVSLQFGEYRPDQGEPPWGVDMLAIGSHNFDRGVQVTGNGTWARPAWAATTPFPTDLSTDRAFLTEGAGPLVPGASLRGPMRHLFSRIKRVAGKHIRDPHEVQGDVGNEDEAGRVFGTVVQSSRVLVRDAHVEPGWSAARLHMHAEDEFSAGSYGSAKRDAVRMLSGTFRTQIIVEGPDDGAVGPLCKSIDQLIDVGTIGHLAVGGHKTRGAGWGRWLASWRNCDVRKHRSWAPLDDAPMLRTERSDSSRALSNVPLAATDSLSPSLRLPERVTVKVTSQRMQEVNRLTLGEAVRRARAILSDDRLVAWWCEPAIDFRVNSAKPTFGRRNWPGSDDEMLVDEVAFFGPNAVWRAAKTAVGWRVVYITEGSVGEGATQEVEAVVTRARLHMDMNRFSAALIERGWTAVREWHTSDGILGYTLVEGSGT